MWGGVESEWDEEEDDHPLLPSTSVDVKAVQDAVNKGLEAKIPPPRALHNFRQYMTNEERMRVAMKSINRPLNPTPVLQHTTPKEPEPCLVENNATNRSHPPLHRQQTTSNVKKVYDRAEAEHEEHSSQGGSNPRALCPYYTLTSPNDDTLVFESRFECGNLGKAIKCGPVDYELSLSTDTNTSRHTQWFFFQVTNARPGISYNFSIVNLMKSGSLYSSGMQPLLYSVRRVTEDGVGWSRHGRRIQYFQNQHRTASGSFMYTLSFTLNFPYAQDTCYLAYCYPYTYTDLKRYLLSLEDSPRQSPLIRRKTLCKTEAGNECEFLTITSKVTDPSLLKKRKGIVITARVHPGETNASWMMKGFLDFILSTNPVAEALREHFVFKVVPMLNPDGVILGNYRCNIFGLDLNRQWKYPRKMRSATILATKEMIRQFQKERDVVLFCDFHGHSRKQNVFLYGCKHNPSHFPEKRLMERVFPMILEGVATVFSLKSSNFAVQESRDTTARIAVWKELNIDLSYTMEASFAGATFGPRQGMQLSIHDLEKMGSDFGVAVFEYFLQPNKAESVLEELRRVDRERIAQGLSSLVDEGEGSSESGSDSDPTPDFEELSEKDDPPPHTSKKSVHRRKVPKKPASVSSTSAGDEGVALPATISATGRRIRPPSKTKRTITSSTPGDRVPRSSDVFTQPPSTSRRAEGFESRRPDIVPPTPPLSLLHYPPKSPRASVRNTHAFSRRDTFSTSNNTSSAPITPFSASHRSMCTKIRTFEFPQLAEDTSYNSTSPRIRLSASSPRPSQDRVFSWGEGAETITSKIYTQAQARRALSVEQGKRRGRGVMDPTMQKDKA